LGFTGHSDFGFQHCGEHVLTSTRRRDSCEAPRYETTNFTNRVAPSTRPSVILRFLPTPLAVPILPLVLALGFSTGDFNTALGFHAGLGATTGSGNVYIGANIDGVAGESQHTYIRNINDTTVSGGSADTVTVDLTTGLLGHLSSSRRYKEEIKPMNDASEALFALKPVTYRYKKEIDSTQSPAFGLIAEQVAAVNPDLVARNAQGSLRACTTKW
jgi:hypothetical protein